MAACLPGADVYMGTQRRSVQALLDDSKADKFILLEGESLFFHRELRCVSPKPELVEHSLKAVMAELEANGRSKAQVLTKVDCMLCNRLFSSQLISSNHVL